MGKDFVFRLSELTERESDVFDLLILGLTDKEISDRLNISRRTASNHVRGILSKLNTSDRTKLVVLYYQDRLSTLLSVAGKFNDNYSDQQNVY